MRGLKFLYRGALLAATVLLFSACSAPPRSKWLDQNSKTGIGTYQWKDGSRYVGRFAGDAFQGTGIITYYSYKNLAQFYENDSDLPSPPQLDRATLTAEWAADRLRAGLPVTLVAPNPGDAAMPFTYVGLWNAGTEGRGVVTFKDGRRFEGTFTTAPAPYYSIVSISETQSRVKWKDSSILGSYFSGLGKMSWPDGTTFEGSVYKYHLFHRRGMNYEHRCAYPRLVGKGVLKHPDRPDYEGFVMEGHPLSNTPYRPLRASESDFNEYVDEVEQCASKLRSAQAGDAYWNNKHAAEHAQARRAASAMLQRDLAAISANIPRQMANVEAASRGSSVAEDRARLERDTRFQAGIAAERDDPNSEYNRTRRDNERRAADTRRREDAARPAQRTEIARKEEPVKETRGTDARKEYRVRRDISYTGDMGRKTQEDAVMDAVKKRRERESMANGIIGKIEKTSDGPMKCEDRNAGVKPSKFFCTFTVSYDLVTSNNPNPPANPTGGAMSR